MKKNPSENRETTLFTLFLIILNGGSESELRRTEAPPKIPLVVPMYISVNQSSHS